MVNALCQHIKGTVISWKIGKNCDTNGKGRSVGIADRVPFAGGQMPPSFVTC